MDFLHREVPDEFIILDVETTGLDDDWDEIVEIGALRVKTTNKIERITCLDELLTLAENPPSPANFVEIACFHTFVYSGVDIDEKVSKLNGITNDLLDDKGIEPEEATEQLSAFIGDIPIVTYNRYFLTTFLTDLTETSNIEIDNDISCIQSQLKRLVTEEIDYSLKNMSKYLGISTPHKFKSLDDCRLILELLNKII